MGKILGLAAKKQGGKNTSANFILGVYMFNLGIIKAFKITDQGQLWVNDLLGNKAARGIFDVTSINEHVRGFCESELDPYIKLYSFADSLKTDVCMNILGLTWEQCYGTDSHKNTATHLMWENMPGVITSEDEWYHLKNPENLNLIYHEPGFMTAREVLQVVGTNTFRKMYHDVWADTCLRKIEKDNPDFAIISDVRFPNEVDTIQKAGGKIMRLTRDACPADAHTSETALDKENFDWDKFDFIIDNANLTIEGQNEAIYKALHPIGWMPVIANDDT